MGTFGFFLNIPKPLDFAAESCEIGDLHKGNISLPARTIIFPIANFTSLLFNFQDIESLYPENYDQAYLFTAAKSTDGTARLFFCISSRKKK